MKKWIVIAVLLLLPWLLVASCSKKPVAPTPTVQRVHPVAKPAVKHIEKRTAKPKVIRKVVHKVQPPTPKEVLFLGIPGLVMYYE